MEIFFFYLQTNVFNVAIEISQSKEVMPIVLITIPCLNKIKIVFSQFFESLLIFSFTWEVTSINFYCSISDFVLVRI